MLQGYEIKKNNLTEQLTGDMIFENTFSDYELYQILESCKYKTTEKNLKVLKEGLASGRYYIEDQLDDLLIQEFKEYLNEDPLILTEDILNEGKILNKIRWKLALFSLRFLTETSINAFFIAYYADKKTGEATDNGKEFCRKSKKEKLKKMRELANGMKEEDKQKIINSQAAKQCEKSALMSGVVAGVAGIGAGVSGYANNTAATVKKNINSASEDLFTDDPNRKVALHYGVSDDTSLNTIDWGSIRSANGQNIGIEARTVGKRPGVSAGFEARVADATANKIVSAAGAIASLSGLTYATMWAGIIVAGVATVKGVLSLHKAITIRRDEIMAELKGKMDPAKAKELAKQYKQEFKQEKKNKH